MSTTVDELQAVLRRFEAESGENPDFVRLRKFYMEMASKGLLIQKRYDLPLVDTIGLTAHHPSAKWMD